MYHWLSIAVAFFWVPLHFTFITFSISRFHFIGVVLRTCLYSIVHHRKNLTEFWCTNETLVWAGWIDYHFELYIQHVQFGQGWIGISTDVRKWFKSNDIKKALMVKIRSSKLARQDDVKEGFRDILFVVRKHQNDVLDLLIQFNF